MNTKGVAQEKGKLKELLEKHVSNGSKKGSKPEEQKLSGLGNQENLKAKLHPHRINETENAVKGAVEATEERGTFFT